ncbi:MAG: type II secretion system protein N [Pseudomonadota bacterium]
MNTTPKHPATKETRLHSQSAALREVAVKLWWRATSPRPVRLLRAALAMLAMLSIAWSLVTASRGFLQTSAVLSRDARIGVAPDRVAGTGQRPQIDIDLLSRSPLFGTPGSSAEETALRERLARLEAEAQALADIEDNAEESRLPLLLVGLFYTADIATDRAVIESSQTQAQYSAGDELPLGGDVSVAKILADRVILDNGGRYEFLPLYDDSGRITSQASLDRTADAAAERGRQAELDARNRRIRELASVQRRGAVSADDPLSSVINIEAASSDGALIGYRVSPARDSARLEALGFRDGDIIVSVNGTSLDNPSQGSRLSRALRSGGSTRYGILRDGEEMSLTLRGTRSLAQ